MTDRIIATVWWDYENSPPNRKMIYGICGNVSLYDVEMFERMFNDPDSEVVIPPDPAGYIIGVECSIHYSPKEVQYGSGYGDVLTLEGYWYPHIERYVVIDVNNEDGNRVYFGCEDFENKLAEHVCIASRQKTNHTLDSFCDDGK